MRSHASSITSEHIQDAHSIIPWWQDLSPDVSSLLALPISENLRSQRYDVAVIGGGVAGLSAALSARETGASVVLLECEQMLGYGATGRNAGILSAGVNMHIADLPPDSTGAAFWPETTHVLLSLAKEAAKPESILKAQLTGAISLAESRHAAKKLAREERVRVAAGLHAEMWTGEQVTEATQGHLDTHTVTAALWLPDEGRIQPLTLLAYLAQKARKAGVELVGQANVSTYREQKQQGYTWQLTLASGQTLLSRGLVRATGPTIEPNARIYALSFAVELPDTFPLFWDAAPYTYVDFRAGNGRLTVSGGRYGRALVTQRDKNYYKRLADAARHWLPELARQEPSYAWGVDLNVSAEMIPELHTMGEHALSIDGLGALGVLPGIILGRRAGQSILQE